MDGLHAKPMTEILAKKTFTLQPRFTIIYHPIRVELGLNNNEYIVIDSINQLSHRPDHPWCIQTKKQIAAFTGISERTVYRAIERGIDLGLIERSERDELRSTANWVETVTLYKEKTTKR
jgi:DNA-binding MarR family transcriptional regulator